MVQRLAASVIHPNRVSWLLANPFLVVASITVLGGLARLYHLGFKSLWVDEATMYWVSRGNFWEIIAENAAQQSSPPFFALLANFVSRIGESETILRAPSCFAGILAIPAIYLLSREFLARGASYFCSLIVAFAPTQVNYSQQFREYAIAFLVSILMLVFFVRYLRQPNWENWGSVVLSMAFAVFVQYGLGLLVLALNLVMGVELVFKPNRKRRLVGWVTAQSLVIGAVFLVYQLALQQQIAAWPTGPGASPTSSHLNPAYWDGTLSSFAVLCLVNTARLFYFAYPNPFLVLLTFLLGSLAALRMANGRLALLLFAVPMLMTLMLALARRYPYDAARQDIFLTPMIYVLMGFGFDYLSRTYRNWIVPAALVLVMGLSGISRTYAYLQSTEPENLRPLVTMLSSLVEPEDRVYVYYGAISPFRYYHPAQSDQAIYGTASREEPEKYFRQLDPVLQQPGRLWIIYSHCYNQECVEILDYVSRSRKVDRIATGVDVGLFVAAKSE